MKLKLKMKQFSGWKFCAALLALIGVFCLRSFKLDVDLPGYGVGAYNPSDEGIYAFMAINQYNYGSLNPEVEVNDSLKVVPYTAYHCRNNMLENVLVYAGMRLLGDNYAGFRMPIVFISLINLLLILTAVRLVAKRYGCDPIWGNWLIIAVGAFYTFSFPYLISSRVVEPTIIRMTFGLLAFVILLGVRNNRLRFFLMGFIVTISLELVYITNLFLYIPIFMAGCAVGLKQGKKQFFNSAVFCVLGCLCSLAICAAYYYVVWDTSFVINALNIYRDFSNVAGYTTIVSSNNPGFIWSILTAALKFFSSNTFLYHLPLLTAFLLCMPAMIHLLFRQRDEVLVFSMAAVIGLLLQTCFTEDYIFRKAYVIQPFVVFALIIYLLNWIQRKEDDRRAKSLFAWCIWIVYTVIVLCFGLFCLHYRLLSPKSDTVNDFTMLLKLLLLLTQGGGAIAVVVLFWRYYYILGDDNRKSIIQSLQKFKRLKIISKSVEIINRSQVFHRGLYAFYKTVGRIFEDIHRVSRIVLWLCAITIIGGFALASGLCSVRYVWNNHYTMERDAMMELDEYSGQTLFGSYSYGFSLYNDMKPVLLEKEDFWDMLPDNYNDVLYIDVSTSAGAYVRSYFENDAFLGSDYTVAEVELLERRFSLNGNTVHFGLYRPVLKQNLGFYEQIIAMERAKDNEDDEGEGEAEDRTELYAEVAMQVYQIDKKYERLSAHADEIELLRLAAEEVEAVEALMREKDIESWERGYFVNYPAQIGNINFPIYGSIYGDVRGDINDHVYGDIYGNVYGHINVPVYGKIYGVVIEPTQGEFKGYLKEN